MVREESSDKEMPEQFSGQPREQEDSCNVNVVRHVGFLLEMGEGPTHKDRTFGKAEAKDYGV